MSSQSPLVRSIHWLWPGKPPLANARWVVATQQSVALAHDFLAELAAHRDRPLALLLLDEGDYEGPWPWALLPKLGPARVLLRLKPTSLIFLDDRPPARALARLARCPVWWINGRSADLLLLGRVTAASAVCATAIGGGFVTGDPCLDGSTWPHVNRDTAFCSRFQSVRLAARWIIYFAGTCAGEETLAYNTFLNMSARSGGLLALAPVDEARHEEVYRESIKYHLLTTRQRRLITSEVPPKTRVYYIEDPSARLAMYPCADLIVVGGTFVDGPVDMLAALSAGVPVIVGPKRADPLVAAAVRAGVVMACADDEELTVKGAALLSDPLARARAAQALQDWIALQPGARARVVSLLDGDLS